MQSSTWPDMHWSGTGSKISASSVVHMIWEMAAILIGYSWSGWWAVVTPSEVLEQ
jgi:hypothetical protein